MIADESLEQWFPTQLKKDIMMSQKHINISTGLC